MRAPGESSRARPGNVVEIRVAVAGDILRRDGHDRAGLQQNGLWLLQRAGADFGALQILQNADGASFAFGGAAQALDVVGVIFVRAVRKIQAGNVHAQAQKIAHGGFACCTPDRWCR